MNEQPDRLRESIELLVRDLTYIGAISRHEVPIFGRDYIVTRLRYALSRPSDTHVVYHTTVTGDRVPIVKPGPAPDRCPTCGSRYRDEYGDSGKCPDPFHSPEGDK